MNKYRKSNSPLDLDPEVRATAEMLDQAAGQIHPDPAFSARLERQLAAAHPRPEVSSMFSLRKVTPALLWVLAAIVMVVVVEWAIRSLVPQPVPAAQNTPAATTQEAPAPPPDAPTAVPSGTSYDWNGITLYAPASMPAAPADAGVYVGRQAPHATVEEALALAQRFGIQGSAYQTPGELPDTTDYFITDGKQSLHVRSANYFSYTADIVRAWNAFGAVKNPEAEAIIGSYLESHGFDFPRLIEWSDFRNGYIVQPLSADGTPITYEHFSSPLLVVTLDEQGQVASLMAGLMDVNADPVGRYGIISAEEALQRVLQPGLVDGMIEGMNGSGGPIQQWTRSIPLDQTRTFYGTIFNTQAVQAGQPPFIRLDGYPVAGQIAGLDQLPPHTQVQVTGRLVAENGVQRLQVDSWTRASVLEDGLGGTLQREGDRLIFLSEQGDRLTIPDPPADLPLPFENAFVLGTREGEVFQWKLIDNRMALGGGGGGGGGGSGFYKLNLTGTPVAFPSPTAGPNAGDPGTGEYIVQPGDTLSGIAAASNTDVGALMQANGLTDPGMLTVGQKLVIPGAAAPQKVEGLRGTLNITISKQPDGSQYFTYGFLTNAGAQPGESMLLQGDSLEELQRYNSRPVDVWGTLHNPGSGGTIPTISVDRFEIPFPDLKVQVLQGTQKQTEIAGQPAVLFTASDGTTYVELFADGSTGGPMIGNEGDQVLLECVAVPGETVGGYPGLRFFGGQLAIDPKTGLHVTMPLTMDQPHIVDMPSIGKPGELPTATIEKIELVHFVSDPRYRLKDGNTQELYFQPVWRFYGHYSTGDEFEILVQALKQEYLLPELEPGMQPG